MKKFFTIAALLCVIATNAQKRVTVYNLSSYVVHLNSIMTVPTTANLSNSSTFYPWYGSASFSSPVIQPATTYVLQKTTSLTKFPFNGDPIFDNWRKIPLTGSPVLTPSAAAWASTDAAKQQFANASVGVDSPPFTFSVQLGSEPLDFQAQTVEEYDDITFPWTAGFAQDGDETYIVISDR